MSRYRRHNDEFGDDDFVFRYGPRRILIYCRRRHLIAGAATAGTGAVYLYLHGRGLA